MIQTARLTRLVSGGQTGVDRAALDAAIDLDLPVGGWCPKGRRAEDGPLANRYPLHETPTASYRQRTEWNVRDSDATLVLTRGVLQGGTRLTVEFAQRLGRPCLVLDLESACEVDAVLDWIRSHRVRTLNVAGPRESSRPGIYREARQFVERLINGTGLGPTLPSD